MQPHLVIVDYAVNDGLAGVDTPGDRWAQSIQSKTRQLAIKLLELPTAPAVLWLGTFSALVEHKAEGVLNGDPKVVKPLQKECTDGLSGDGLDAVMHGLTLAPEPICARYYRTQVGSSATRYMCTE